MTSRQTSYINIINDQNISLPLFLQPQLYNQVLGSDQWDVAYILENQKLVASWIVHTKNKMGFKFISVPTLFKYGGPFFNEVSPQKKLINSLLTQLGRYNHWIQNVSPQLTSQSDLFSDIFGIEYYYTYRLHNTYDINHHFNEMCRDYKNNKIRKAKPVLTIRTDIDLKTFYEVNQKSFLRQGIEVPYRFSYLQKLDNYLMLHNQRQIFGAIDAQGRVHSVAYLAWDQDTAYLIAAGDDPKLRKSGSGILLTWHTIEFAFEQLQKSTYDFLGSMIPSVERVRKNFGAQKTTYLNLSDQPHRLLNLLMDYKNKIRK